MESAALIQTRSTNSRTVSKSTNVGNQTVNKAPRANVSEDEPPTSFETAVSQTIFGNRQTEHAVMVAVMLLIGIAAFELVHLDCTGVDLTSPFHLFDDVQRQQSQAKEGPLRGAMRLWKLYLTERWRLSAVCIGLISAMILMHQYANLLLVDWADKFWGKLSDWNSAKDGMMHWYQLQALCAQFLMYALMALFATAYRYYLTSMFVLLVRENVTERYTSNWLSDFSSYRLELTKGQDGADASNPDQRIQEDVQVFISSSVDLSVGAVNSLLQFFMFSMKTYTLSPQNVFGYEGLHFPGWLLWLAILYAGVSTYVTMMVSWRLEGLEGTNQWTEADFRFELVTVRQRAETIALARSEAVHLGRLKERFGVLRRSIWESMLAQKKYLMVSSFFEQVEVMVPIVLLGPSFLRGEITFGQLMATNRCINLLSGALLWFASSYLSVARWRASTGRLIRFQEAISKHVQSKSGGVTFCEGDGRPSLALKALTIWKPEEAEVKGTSGGRRESKECLFEKLSLDFQEGWRVLVHGPSGVGKSTLLRAISGAWPFAEGEVWTPGRCSLLVFPAEVYVPAGQLRSAVCYPSAAGAEGFADEDVERALTTVGLGQFLEEPSLDAVEDWDMVLSSGQKARVSLARLLLNKPKVACLDEPVAHLQESARAPLLEQVFRELDPESVVLMVTHDLSPDIVKLFNRALHVDTEKTTLSQSFAG